MIRKIHTIFKILKFKITKRSWLTELLLSYKLIQKNDTVLDLGCGIGHNLKNIRYKIIFGVDVYDYEKKYLTNCKNAFFVQANIIDCLDFLPKIFDTILLIDVIEHLEKESGAKLLEKIDTNFSYSKLVILTPAVFSDNKENTTNKKNWSYDNEHNLHLSLWTKKDFLERGFEMLKTPYDEQYIFCVKNKKGVDEE